MVDDRGDRRCARAQAPSSLPAPTPPRGAGDRRHRRAVRRNDQSAGRLRPGPGARGARRRGAWPISSSCSSIPPRSTPGSIRCRWSARRVRGEGAMLIDETGTRFMAGRGRGELAPRDVVARASRRTSRPAIASFSMRAPALGADFAAALPRHHGALPRRRHRSGARSRSRSRRPRTTTWAASPWTPRAAAPSRACGPAARWRRPACTAPTGWPATRCSRRVVMAGAVADSSPPREPAPLPAARPVALPRGARRRRRCAARSCRDAGRRARRRRPGGSGRRICSRSPQGRRRRPIRRWSALMIATAALAPRGKPRRPLARPTSRRPRLPGRAAVQHVHDTGDAARLPGRAAPPSRNRSSPEPEP